MIRKLLASTAIAGRNGESLRKQKLAEQLVQVPQADQQQAKERSNQQRVPDGAWLQAAVGAFEAKLQ